MAYTYLTPYRRGGSSLFELHNQMNRMFDELLGPDAKDRSAKQDNDDKDSGVTSWPSLEIIQDDGQILVQAELAGMNRDDIEIGMDDGMLTLSGEKRRHKESENGYSEFAYGRFERQISIPSTIDLEQASAEFDNGLLTITLPKMEEVNSGRKIAISEGKDDRKLADGSNRSNQGKSTSKTDQGAKKDQNAKKDKDNKKDD